MSEREWRWIPASEPPGEDPRKICVLKDGEKDVYWWTDILGFEENVTHWCEVRFPPLPEPELPLIRRVCEWLGIVTMWAEPLETPVWHDALLWRIEEALDKRGLEVDVGPRRGGMAGGSLWTARACYGVICQSFYANARGEALLKAALWVMGQEGSDG